MTPSYLRLKQILLEVKAHTDLTRKSTPFFVEKVHEIRVELLKISAAQGEQITREVSDAMRLITISQREDLNNIENYPREIPKFLGRMRDAIIYNLTFVEKMKG